METGATFGAWLQRRRKALDLTQDALAQRVSCSVATIRKIEADERRPSRQVAELLADALDIPQAERSAFLAAARGVATATAATTLQVAAPPAPAAPPPARSLPAPASSLIGRDRELARIRQLLLDPACRLLTLVGPGGIGKTRLALQVALEHADAFEDGTAFVSLASVSAPDYIVPAIAEALGFAFYGGADDPRSQLLRFLEPKEVLLVLDNFEHLLEGATLLNDVLARAPRVKLLATSREGLNLRGEWVFELQGLHVPEETASSAPEGDRDPGGALTLFLQRARQARVGFEPAPEDWRHIARICRMVDGMPLGIELAAGWIRTLNCREIADEITRDLDFLATTRRDMPDRHRSMRAVFEHTWRLLLPDEQRVLRQLSVFRGGFTREAAAQVAHANLASLSALVTKSLVQRAADGRYGLHELVRQFGAEWLTRTPEEEAQVRERHCDFYIAFAQARVPVLESARQITAIGELTVDIDNLRVAVEWALAHDKVVAARRALRGLGYFFELRDTFQEAHGIYAQAVRALRAAGAEGDERRVALGHMLGCHGWFCFRVGLAGQAREALLEGLAILQPGDDPAALADLRLWLGFTSVFGGDMPFAQRMLNESFEIGTPFQRAFALALLSIVAQAHGDLAGALSRAEESLKAWRAIGDPRGLVFCLNHMGGVAAAIGGARLAEARGALEESMAITAAIDDRWGTANTRKQLGLLALAEGAPAEAQHLFEASIALYAEIGDRWGQADALNLLGRTHLSVQDLGEAEACCLGALRLAIDTHTLPVALRALLGLAEVTAMAHGDGAAQALTWTTCVLRHPACDQETRRRAEELRAALVQRVPAGAVLAADDFAGDALFEREVASILAAA